MLASRLIERSLRLIGVQQAAEPMDAQDAQDALDVLNDLLEDWRLHRLLVYSRERLLFPLTAGVGQYTLGPGGTLNASLAPTLPRPIAVEDARWVTQSGPQQLDTPLRLLTEGEYTAITLKGLPSSWALWAYYNPTYPLGTFVLWPVPSVSASVRLTLWTALAAIPTIETDVDLPPGYRRALQYALAMELAPEFGTAITPELAAMAMESKDSLMRVNARPMLLSTAGVARSSRYNYINDEYR